MHEEICKKKLGKKVKNVFGSHSFGSFRDIDF